LEIELIEKPQLEHWSEWWKTVV